MRSTKKHGNADMLSRLSRKIKNELPIDNMIYSIPIGTLHSTVDEIHKKTSNDHDLPRF